MHVRVNTTPNSPRKSVQIVNSVRTGDKVRTKILRHVGIAMDDDELVKLKVLAYDIIAKMQQEAEKTSGQTSFLNEDTGDIAKSMQSAAETRKRGRPATKKIEDILPPNQVHLDEIVEEKRIVEGVDDIASKVYEDLGLDDLGLKVRASEILKSIVLTRLVEPHSKHKLQQILESKFDESHDLDAMYRAMDSAHPKIDLIKRKVFDATKKLLPETLNLMFFDVTTLYFESIETDGLREFGYSKDHRFNTTQVVLAMATNLEGLPIGYELFAGNTAEVKTLIASIAKWKENFDIKDVCFVGDRAMFSKGNLDMLDEYGYKYVIAAKLRNMNGKMQESILDGDNYRLTSMGNMLTWMAEFEHEKRRLVVSYKASRAHNDSKNRQRILDKITKQLGKSDETGKLITNNGIKKYTETSGESNATLSQEKIELDEQWDGLHGVITNIRDQEASVVIGMYARAWIIEEAFRINKHNLKVRPIYHWKQDRIESHIAMCYMTFAVLKHIQYRVNLTQKISPTEVMEELLNVQSSIYVHKVTKDRYRVPGVITHKASKIYKAFGLTRSSNAEIYLK